MNMDIDNVIVEDELDDQLGDLLLAELLNSTAQAEQLVADLVGNSAGHCTAKRRITLRSTVVYVITRGNHVTLVSKLRAKLSGSRY